MAEQLGVEKAQADQDRRAALIGEKRQGENRRMKEREGERIEKRRNGRIRRGNGNAMRPARWRL
ncbi:hypothetical protein [Bartonella sp. W8167]|uniref:hypothetical protein n=1 Tax=Bartonella sp. W8167 TaxID=2751022 RepID=UPI001AEE1251|nr:hypothetical protein [Bartonella sp. W8167]